MKYLYPGSALALCLLLTACTSVPKLLDKGRYADAYDLALRQATAVRITRLKPNNRRYQNYVAAYAAVQARDLAVAEETAAGTDPARFDPLFEAYDRLFERSLDLRRVAPTAARPARYPHLAPAVLAQKRETARHLAATYYADRIEQLLPAARRGEKPAARRAYLLHDKLDYFQPERRHDFAERRAWLRETGILRLHLYAVDSPYAPQLHDLLTAREPERLEWTEVAFSPPPTVRIDKEAEVTVLEAVADDYDETCREREYEKEVLDHVERRKVKVKVNDSTEVIKIVEIKHYKKIYATVTECTQSAVARVRAAIDVYGLGASREEYGMEVTSRYEWSHDYRLVAGDRRAITGMSMEIRPDYPPARETLIERALAKLPARATDRLLGLYERKEDVEKARRRRWGFY